jgi:energy-coupling factor transporter transmembrane protein EcfT
MTLRGFGKGKRRSWYNARPLRRSDAAVFAVMLVFLVFVLWMRSRVDAMFWYPW